MISQFSPPDVTQFSTPVQSAQIVIELKHISKSFGTIRALDNLSLSIRSGEIYGLLGPNGAGKSTLVNIICGLLQASEGSVSVAGFNVTTNPLGAKRSIGVVPQDLALYSELSVRQNLVFFGRLYGLGRSELQTRIDQLLVMVRLEGRDKSNVGTLSGGMQRRVNIAAALLHKPAVVLMDEATVGLDPQNRANIIEIVHTIAADGAAVLYSTHYMDEVEQTCGRIGIIDHGKVLIEGTLSELREKAGGKEVVSLRGNFNPAIAATAFSLSTSEDIIKCSNEEIVLNLQNAEGRLSQLLIEAARAGDVRDVSMNRQSLESLFIQLTGRDLRS